MNKDLLIHLMTDSFKQANIKLSVESGINEDQAKHMVDSMHESIFKCMNSVLDNLIENFPNFIK